MLPLTLDDLLPLEEYANRRREFVESLGRYLDRYRRVRVGPKVTLVFENRQTLWFRVHEIIRIARLRDPSRLQKELDLYNTLLPGSNTLQAALLLDVGDGTDLSKQLTPWQEFNGSQLRFCLGAENTPATLITSRTEDLSVGAAHWIQFTLTGAGRKHLINFRERALLELTLPEYQHQSAPLSDEIRQSLVDDLELSDRDQAA